MWATSSACPTTATPSLHWRRYARLPTAEHSVSLAKGWLSFTCVVLHFISLHTFVLTLSSSFCPYHLPPLLHQAILSRKLMVEEMHDVMMKVAEMVVISESDIVRTQSRHVSSWFTSNQTLCKHILTHRHAHTDALPYPHTAHTHTHGVHAHTHNSTHTAVSHCRCCSSFFWTTP